MDKRKGFWDGGEYRSRGMGMGMRNARSQKREPQVVTMHIFRREKGEWLQTEDRPNSKNTP
jgi:hypothetical protein